MTERRDVVIVGGGHNALVAAALLGRRGYSVLVLERLSALGGAAVSARPFAGVDVRMSRYAYLVSLLPSSLASELGLGVELRRRRVASCTPDGRAALVVSGSPEETRRSFESTTGSVHEYGNFIAWQELTQQMAAAVAPTLLRPLASAASMRALAGGEAFDLLAGQPLGRSLDERFESDLVQGLVLTDGLIGTFASADEASLRQNRCLLYHVIGNGTGHWDVPVGGMGALSEALRGAAVAGGAELRTGVEVVAVKADGAAAEVVTADGEVFPARVVLCGAAPAVLERLVGWEGPAALLRGAGGGSGGGHGHGLAAARPPEGAQLKLNMVVERLPRLRAGVEAREAFAGTLHVNERRSQLEGAYVAAGGAGAGGAGAGPGAGARPGAGAASGSLPESLPCEVYCHSLTDPSILGAELRGRGVQTVSVFALQTPARLFGAGAGGAGAGGAGACGASADGAGAGGPGAGGASAGGPGGPGAGSAVSARAAEDAVLASLQSVLAEPLEDVLLVDADGRRCVETHTPLDLEHDLALPGGHIFHGDLQWPWAESDEEIGRWGVETAIANVFVCGSGARRGGGVSGIAGHNAAMAGFASSAPALRPA